MKHIHFRPLRAQSMTEYLLLVCMIAVAIIPIVTILSKTIQDQIEVSAKRIAGQDVQGNRAKSTAARGESKIGRGLDDFWKD